MRPHRKADVTIINQSGQTSNNVVQGQKRFQHESTFLEPGLAKRIGLGAYYKSELKPEFALTFEPNDAQEYVWSAFEETDIPGSPRTLHTCVLLNTSDKRCRVTVALREG